MDGVTTDVDCKNTPDGNAATCTSHATTPKCTSTYRLEYTRYENPPWFRPPPPACRTS